MRDFDVTDRVPLRLDDDQKEAIVTKKLVDLFDKKFEELLKLVAKPFCNSKAACEYLHCGKTTLFKLINEGKIKSYGKPGSTLLFKRIELYQYVVSTERK